MNATLETLQRATSKIAPAWPLKNVVAVNPYLGFTGDPITDTADRLGEGVGLKVSMSLEYYLRLFRNKQITTSAIDRALELHNEKMSAHEFIQTCDNQIHNKLNDKSSTRNTITSIVEELEGVHWTEFMRNRVSNWAASYFDEFQASWNSVDRNSSLFVSWKKEVVHDRSFKIAGLKQFSKSIGELPDNEIEAAQLIFQTLRLKENDVDTYLSRLLFDVVGWSSYISGVDWNNNLYAEKTQHLNSFLCVLLACEYGIYKSIDSKRVDPIWDTLLNQPHQPDRTQRLQLIFQDALDLMYQHSLETKLRNKQLPTVESRPKLQAMFCIDVRSEVYRRHLERRDQLIETKGYAGFFGIPLKYSPIGAENGKNLCPVLLPSGPVVKETTSKQNYKGVERRRLHQFEFFRSFKAFKSGPVSSFGFVSPLGLAYLPKLVGDALKLTRPVLNPDKLGHTRKSWATRNVDLSAIPEVDKINMALGAINSMGFNNRFAQIVLITGHGATSVNNPHAAGLECGACGGHDGEVNARTAAQILNDLHIRNMLRDKNVFIPEDTVFVPCLHNTTTDEIHILETSMVQQIHPELFIWVKDQLKIASNTARIERSTRLSMTGKKIREEIYSRTKDWSQVRPEWGLAGCSSFIIAERKNTRGVDLEGKSFLHDYDWKSDESSAILESIMTAPMVVTSWINLQYYASTVDPEHFGAGNKTLHNVTSGLGVIEGSSGDLRIGLPYQSIHNGKDFEHVPHRLTVIIQAPTERINAILEKHKNVRDLFDNGWIHLLSMNDKGLLSQRYLGNLNWDEMEALRASEKQKEESLTY